MASSAKAGKVMSGTGKSRSIARMRDDALDAMVAEFDREFIADGFGPMTGEARRRHMRAKRKRGRPQVGSGSQRISVTVEKALLKKADRLAKRLGVSRAKLIAVGLWKMIGDAEDTSERA